MTLTDLQPILYTWAMDKTIEFYTDVLGFTVAERDNDWGWASLMKDDVAIMFAVPNDEMGFGKLQFTGSFYFSVIDVEMAWLELKDKAKICYELETFDWGMREFAIYDNNGYMLQFGQEIDF